MSEVDTELRCQGLAIAACPRRGRWVYRLRALQQETKALADSAPVFFQVRNAFFWALHKLAA